MARKKKSDEEDTLETGIVEETPESIRLRINKEIEATLGKGVMVQGSEIVGSIGKA